MHELCYTRWMSDRPKNLDGDSQEARVHGHESFLAFLKEQGFADLSLEQRIDKIKNMDAQSFLDFVFQANGKVRNLESVQRWTGKAVHSIVSVAGGGSEYADLEPPENADAAFIESDESIRKE